MSSVDSGFTSKQRTELKGMLDVSFGDFREEMKDLMRSTMRSMGQELKREITTDVISGVASFLAENLMPTIDDHEMRLHKLETVRS